MNTNAREAILAAARDMVQLQGFGGLNVRALASAVGIKAASVYYHFASKADLGAAVARRYREDGALALEAIEADNPDPRECLRRFPEIFRRSLASGNRLCLGSFMGAETHDLPESITREVIGFADVNVAWLTRMLVASGLADANAAGLRAEAMFAAIAGAQLGARTRSDICHFDALIASYRASGLLPG